MCNIIFHSINILAFRKVIIRTECAFLQFKLARFKVTHLFGYEAVRLILQPLLGFLYLQVPLWHHTPLCSPWVLFYLDLLCPPAETTAASGTRVQT